MKGALGVGERGRKLRCLEDAPSDLFVEIHFGLEGVAEALLGIDEANGFSKPLADDSNGFEEVGVVGEDDGALHGVVEGVEKQSDGEVYIGALFLCLEDIDLHWRGVQREERHLFHALQKCPQLNLDFGQGAEGAQVGVLARGFVGVHGVGLDECGEIADSQNLMTREEGLGDCARVNPADAESARGSVIEIESIDGEDGFHKKKQGPRLEATAPRPFAEATRRDDLKLWSRNWRPSRNENAWFRRDAEAGEKRARTDGEL